MITLKPRAYESGREYAEALIEACAPAGVDPLLVLTETASYPKIVKAVDMAEFLVGWFHGATEALDVPLRELWHHLSADLPAPAWKHRAPPPAPTTAPGRRAIALLDEISVAAPAPKPNGLPDERAIARAATKLARTVPQAHPIPTASSPPATAPKPLPAGPAPARTIAPAPTPSVGTGIPKPPAAAPKSKATRSEKPAKPPKPEKITRKSRREAAQPGLGL